MKEIDVQVLMISKSEEMTENALKKLKGIEALEVEVYKEIADAIPYFVNAKPLTLLVVITGYSYSEIIDDAKIETFIKANNNEKLNIKTLLIQPYVSEPLKKLNSDTLEYLECYTTQFKGQDILGIFNPDSELDYLNIYPN